MASTALPSDLLSFTACAAEVAKLEGRPLSRQALTKYVRAHALPIYTVGKREKVSLAEITAARRDFTREVMRGEHNRAALPAVAPAHPRTPAQPPRSAPRPANVTGLDAARDAKTRKETAQAERVELDLAREKGELVHIAEVEAGIADTVAVLTENLMGPTASDAADAVIARLGLDGARKRVIVQVLRQSYQGSLERIGQHFGNKVADLGAKGAATAPDRLDQLITLANELQSAPAVPADGAVHA